jgi:hypothetical protein
VFYYPIFYLTCAIRVSVCPSNKTCESCCRPHALHADCHCVLCDASNPPALLTTLQRLFAYPLTLSNPPITRAARHIHPISVTVLYTCKMCVTLPPSLFTSQLSRRVISFAHSSTLLPRTRVFVSARATCACATQRTACDVPSCPSPLPPRHADSPQRKLRPRTTALSLRLMCQK